MSVVSIVKWSKCLVVLSHGGWWLTNQLTQRRVESDFSLKMFFWKQSSFVCRKRLVNSVKLLGRLTQMVPPSACFYRVISAKLCSRVKCLLIRWMGNGKVGEWLLGVHLADVLHRRRFVFCGIYLIKGGELSEIMFIFAKYRCVFWSDEPYM